MNKIAATIILILLLGLGCNQSECEHHCGSPINIYRLQGDRTHTLLGNNYTWIMHSQWDHEERGMVHKLTIKNYMQDCSRNFFIYKSKMPNDVTRLYKHSIDSIIQLMKNVDSKWSENKFIPEKNKQLLMKYFYFTMDIESLNSSEMSKILKEIDSRRGNLKKDIERWDERIKKLDSLEQDLQKLFTGCSSFKYAESNNQEITPLAHLYYDEANSSFIKLKYYEDSTIHMLYKPSHGYLLSYDEKSKEFCNCCN